MNPYDDYSWHSGLCHHEWLLDYNGYAYQLDELVNIYFNLGLDVDEAIIELDWRNLKEVGS